MKQVDDDAKLVNHDKPMRLSRIPRRRRQQISDVACQQRNMSLTCHARLSACLTFLVAAVSGINTRTLIYIRYT
jgi:hypothetical protein